VPGVSTAPISTTSIDIENASSASIDDRLHLVLRDGMEFISKDRNYLKRQIKAGMVKKPPRSMNEDGKPSRPIQHLLVGRTASIMAPAAHSDGRSGSMSPS
jgi:hypothetical protein